MPTVVGLLRGASVHDPPFPAFPADRSLHQDRFPRPGVLPAGKNRAPWEAVYVLEIPHDACEQRRDGAQAVLTPPDRRGRADGETGRRKGPPHYPCWQIPSVLLPRRVPAVDQRVLGRHELGWPQALPPLRGG